MTPHNYNTGLPGLILDILLPDGTPVRALDIVRPVRDRFSGDHVRKTLSEMVEAGRIARPRRGYYARVPA